MRVVKALEQHLLAPDMVEVAIEAFRAERQVIARDRAKVRAAQERGWPMRSASSSGILKSSKPVATRQLWRRS